MELTKHHPEQSDAIAVGTGSVSYVEGSGDAAHVVDEQDVDLVLFDSWVLIDELAASTWIPRDRVESVTFC
jgi:hypothetical protein